MTQSTIITEVAEMVAPTPPPIKGGWKEYRKVFDPELITNAIDAVKIALSFYCRGSFDTKGTSW